MTEAAAPQGITGTLPPPSANTSGRSPPAPRTAAREQLQIRISGMRALLIGVFAVLIVAVIFIIQNAHTANISFLGVHLILPLAGALLGAAIAGSLLTVAAGSARITRLRQFLQRGLRGAGTGLSSPQLPVVPVKRNAPTTGPEAPWAFFSDSRPVKTDHLPTTRD